MDDSIYYSVIGGPPEHHDLWRLSLADGAISRLTKLEGQRGRLGYYFAADARYLYLHLVRGRRRHLGHGCRDEHRQVIGCPGPVPER